MNDGKKKPLKKPQRPASSSALVGRKNNDPRRPAPYVRTDSDERTTNDNKGVSIPEEIAPPSLLPIASCPVIEEKVAPALLEPTTSRFGDSVGLLSCILQRNKHHVTDCRAEDQTRVSVVKSARTDSVVISSKAATVAHSTNPVISLYGDGFLEIPLSDASKGPESTEPSRLLGNGGFSIYLLLFKAADTENTKQKCKC